MRTGASPKEQQLRKSERTRQAILDAALEFLWNNQFRDLKISKLLSSVGSSRPTFYSCFTDLHQMMEVLLEVLRTDISSVCMPWLEGDGDPVPLLKTNLSALVKVADQRGPCFAPSPRRQLQTPG